MLISRDRLPPTPLPANQLPPGGRCSSDASPPPRPAKPAPASRFPLGEFPAHADGGWTVSFILLPSPTNDEMRSPVFSLVVQLMLVSSSLLLLLLCIVSGEPVDAMNAVDAMDAMGAPSSSTELVLEPGQLYVLGAQGIPLPMESLSSVSSVSSLSSSPLSSSRGGTLTTLVVQVVPGRSSRWWWRPRPRSRPLHIRSRFVVDPPVLTTDSTTSDDSTAQTKSRRASRSTTPPRAPFSPWLHERRARSMNEEQWLAVLSSSSSSSSSTAPTTTTTTTTTHGAHQISAVEANRVFASMGWAVRVPVDNDDDGGEQQQGRRRRGGDGGARLLVYTITVPLPGPSSSLSSSSAPTRGHVEWEVCRGRMCWWWWRSLLAGGRSIYRSGTLSVPCQNIRNINNQDDEPTLDNKDAAIITEVFDPDYTARALLPPPERPATQGMIQGFYYSPELRKKLLRGQDGGENQESGDTVDAVDTVDAGDEIDVADEASAEYEPREQPQQQQSQPPEVQNTTPMLATLYEQCQRQWTSACQRWFINAVEKTV